MWQTHYKQTRGWKFAPLINLRDDDKDSMITPYNTASELRGKERRRKKFWITRDVLDLCNERRDLTKMRYEEEGAKEYRKPNRRFQQALKKAKED